MFKSGALTATMAEIEGALLYYETLGRGEPLVLIHGGGMDSRMWDDQFEVLAQEYYVIRYDVPGFGQSEAPAAPFTNAELLRALLDDLSIARAHLVGLLLGGRIAVDMAVEHPARVSSLVLSGPGLSGYKWSEQSRADFDKIDQALRSGGPEAAVEAWLRDPYMLPAMENPAIRERVRQICMENAPAWQVEIPERAIVPPAIERLGEIHGPTLLLVGERDVSDIHAIVDILEKGIAGAKKVVVPEAGHILNMEVPGEFNRLVLEFLHSIDQGGE